MNNKYARNLRHCLLPSKTYNLALLGNQIINILNSK